ncbi:MAG: phenylalanine--tRNA ligase subunit alpha [Candidatus Pacebacteria bacterium]|nr:phenylalanine--tRNA ligase subunit alpha [Candidatus Paceibacterota bacterium]
MDLKKQIKSEIEKALSLKELEQLRIKYLAKKGKINQLFKEIGSLSQAERKKKGQEINKLKEETEKFFKEKKVQIEKKISFKEDRFIDISLPGKKLQRGHIHPLSQVLEKCEDIFERMGFSVVEGPEIENECYNFDALNFPKDHPARDIQDTLWLKEKRRLMRTHTSPVQVRYMEKNNPPLRIVVPGRVFRNEATDVSHEVQFYQLEGLMIEKETSVVDFRAVIQNFFNEFFGRKVDVRMRPGFFPFTEPSFEIDIRGENGKWLECAGAGMVHPNVLKNAKLNPKDWQGFAFGFGIDRLSMIKYNIDDIRLFYSSDIRFLNQF